MVNPEKCKFIEDSIKNGNVKAIIERARQEVELYPVIVPSYKNRSSKMYKYFEENKIKFFVFVYDDDYTASGYDKYDFKYGTIVRITPEDFAQYGMEGKLLGKKRYYIQKYAEKHGIDKYFTVDDDYNPYNCAKYPSKKTAQSKKSKSGKSKNDINHMQYVDMLKSVQYIFDAYDLIMCSPHGGQVLYTYEFDVPYIENGGLNGTFIVNNKQMCENNIFWATEPVYEDDDIVIKLRLAGMRFGRISCFASDNDCSFLKTVIPQKSELSMNLFKKYPWCCDVRLRYNTDLKSWKLTKFFYRTKITETNRPYDKEKYDAAMKMNVEEFMQWLANRDGIDLTKSPKEQQKSRTVEEFF